MKQALKSSNNKKRNTQQSSKKVLYEQLLEIDHHLDQGEGLLSDATSRMDLLKSINDLEHLEQLDLAQRAKIRWAIEGHENSKYFHGVINKERIQQSIPRILVDGEWIDTPDRVKIDFLSHFYEWLNAPSWSRPSLNDVFPHLFSVEQASVLEVDVMCQEIKTVVWDCGSDKAPGPDGFTFNFFLKVLVFSGRCCGVGSFKIL